MGRLHAAKAETDITQHKEDRISIVNSSRIRFWDRGRPARIETVERPPVEDMGGTPMSRGTGVPPVDLSGRSKPDLRPS